MDCPFCIIAAGIAPAADPPNLVSARGSAFPVLSTSQVIAFLDIAPLSPGHILLCPRKHRSKISDLTGREAAAMGLLLPILSRCVVRAVGGKPESASWNIVQANGKYYLTKLYCHY